MRAMVANAVRVGCEGMMAKATLAPLRSNKTETRYGHYLESARLAGLIARWDFSPEKLRLADSTYYTPDFRVVCNDSTIEFHEVKGFIRDDAMVKIKVAAECHPYKFLMVSKTKTGWKTIWQSANVEPDDAKQAVDSPRRTAADGTGKDDDQD